MPWTSWACAMRSWRARTRFSISRIFHVPLKYSVGGGGGGGGGGGEVDQPQASRAHPRRRELIKRTLEQRLLPVEVRNVAQAARDLLPDLEQLAQPLNDLLAAVRAVAVLGEVGRHARVLLNERVKPSLDDREGR